MIFSSSGAEAAAIPTEAALPFTYTAAWMTISGITGLTFPGMIELPGCREGSTISPNPARGPLDSRRRSFPILSRLPARTFKAPISSAWASRQARASKRFSA